MGGEGDMRSEVQKSNAFCVIIQDSPVSTGLKMAHRAGCISPHQKEVSRDQSQSLSLFSLGKGLLDESRIELAAALLGRDDGTNYFLKIRTD
jgi:hypothetical protein